MNQLLSKVDADILFDKEISVKNKYIILKAVREAYSLVNNLENDQRLFQWPVGKNYLNFIKPLAVEFELRNLIDEGKLNFDYRIEPNSIDNCKHIEIIAGKCIMTVSQVQSAEARPRKAVFRDNLCLSRQFAFDFGPDFRVKWNSGSYYLLLTHGYNSITPKHVSLGFPEAYGKGWIKRVDLTKLPVLLDFPDEEVIEEEKLVKFKKHIKELES